MKSKPLIKEVRVVKRVSHVFRNHNPLIRNITRDEYQRLYRHFRIRNGKKKHPLRNCRLTSISNAFHRWENFLEQGGNSVWFTIGKRFKVVHGPIGKLPSLPFNALLGETNAI